MVRNAIVSEIEQNTQNDEKVYNRIQSEQYRNMKKNAISDINLGKEHFENAKKYRNKGEKEKEQDQAKIAAKGLIDGAEKMLKANAIMNGEENRKYYKTGETKKDKKRNKNKKAQIVKKTHSFDILSQTPSNSKVITKQDANILDQYIDKEKGFQSSHTALAYGGVQPKIEDINRIINVVDKIQKHVDNKEKKAIEKKNKKKTNIEKVADDLIEKL